jgi:serine/threonine protein kinase/WD40 repeat protein
MMTGHGPPMDASKSSPREAVEKLAEEFVERYRRGERPDISEYCARLPEHAAEIRDLFPALVMMENIAPEETVARGPPDVPGPAERGDLPERLGDYRILREVGHGGMGVVYEAEHVALGRHVALKVLPFHVAKVPHALERFRREARAAAKLHHSNIVPVFEVGEAGDVKFYAMQFIPGQSLDGVLEEVRRLRTAAAALPAGGELNVETASTRLEATDSLRRPAGPAKDETTTIAVGLLEGHRTAPVPADLPTSSSAAALRGQSDLSTLSGAHPQQYYASVARIGIQVADALAYAHDRGVVHRDIKPSNLLLDLAGTVWITDFGLAKAEGDALTQTGDIVGTLRYMAPERFRGDGDGRSDIYSLGATLYELATLRPVFPATDQLQLIDDVSHSEPAHPRTIDSRIPADLETVILKAIDRDPGRRYQTGAQLAEDLRAFLDYRPIKARRVGWPERTWRWCRRNPVVAGLTVIAAVLLVVIAGGSTIVSMRMRDERDRAIEAERATQRALYNAYVQQAKSDLHSRRPGQRYLTLDAVTSARDIARALGTIDEASLELRNLSIAALALPDLRLTPGRGTWSPELSSCDFDGGFRRFARVESNGDVTVRSVADDGEWAHLPGTGARHAGVQLSRNGEYLAAWRHSGELQIWRLDEGLPAMLFEGKCVVNPDPDFSPDSRLFAFPSADGQVTLVGLSDGKVLRRISARPSPNNVRFHPRERKLAFISHSESSKVVVCEIASETVVTEWPLIAARIAWHPNGAMLATIAGDNRIRLWDVATKKTVRVIEGLKSGGVSFAFNHVGDLLVTYDWSRTLRLWDPWSCRELLQTPAMDMTCLRFSDDDRHVATAFDDGRFALIEVISGREYRTIVPRFADYYLHCRQASISPDGRILACALSSTFGLWDLETGAELAIISEMKGAHSVLFDPAGNLLTSNSDYGVLRWPVRLENARAPTGTIGLPEVVLVPSETMPNRRSAEGLAASGDGRLIATTLRAGGAIRHADDPRGMLRVGRANDTVSIAVSPDGRWVAVGAHGFGRPEIYEVETGELVHSFDIAIPAGVAFSPNGKWLATNGGGCRLWHAGNWEEGPRLAVTRLPLAMGFSADSKILAVESGHGSLQLFDCETGRELARLEDPNQDLSTASPIFSPDGTKLVATNQSNTNAIHVWDLRAIRRVLRELGLDWELPASAAVSLDTPVLSQELEPSAGSPSGWEIVKHRAVPVPFVVDREAIARLSLEWTDQYFNPMIRAGLPLSPEIPGTVVIPSAMKQLIDGVSREVAAGNWIQAIAGSERRLELTDDVAGAKHDFARVIATCPDASLRDSPRAVMLAREALALRPEPAVYWNTLGIAHYRDGRWQEAIAALTKAEEIGRGQRLAENGFFLAMAHWQLGETAAARDWFARSVEWVKKMKDTLSKDPVMSAELARFRSEAAELIEPADANR